MSLINKMLQDLDKRHAADGGGKSVTQQLRPVPVRKDWQRILWEVGIGVVIGAGWLIWVMYQVAPHSVVTDLALRLPRKMPGVAAVPLKPAVAPVPVPAAALQAPPTPPISPPESLKPAESAPAAQADAATHATEAVRVDTFQLATEIATPFEQKRPAVKAAARRAAEAAPARGSAKREPDARAKAARAPPPEAQASIDKQLHVASPAERAENAFRQATLLLKNGRVAEAIDGYKSTLQQDPAHVPARQALIGLLLENRRIDEAQQFLQEGLRLHPDRYGYAMLLARIQVERGDLQGAHDLLGKYAGRAVNDADYHAFDAALLQRLGRHQEAVTAYQAALRIAPRAGLWWMGMGISLQAAVRNAEALQAYQRAKSTGGLSPDLLGFVDQRMKQLR